MGTSQIASSLVLLLLTAQVSAQTCVQLFAENLKPLVFLTESSRLQITQIADGGINSKLIVSQEEFSKNTDQAVIEMIRMVLHNSDFKLEDKNVLIKNKFTLGVPIKDGYSVQLTYESKSESAPRFILQDKIILVTPTGKEFRITEDLVDANQLKINKSEFDLKNYIPNGLELKLKVPLVVEGELLNSFSNLASFFEYFEKQKIRQIFKSDNLTLIKAKFQYGRAKKVFFDVLIKEPFKFLIGGGLMYLAYSASFTNAETQVRAPLYSPPAITQVTIANTINGLPIPKADVQLRSDFEQIKQQALNFSTSKFQNNLNLADINSGIKIGTVSDINSAISSEISHGNGTNAESKQKKSMIKAESVFVIDKTNEHSGLKHTYLVFAEEVAGQHGPGLQYFVMEINSFKYQHLITFLKNQERSLSPDILKTEDKISESTKTSGSTYDSSHKKSVGADRAQTRDKKLEVSK